VVTPAAADLGAGVWPDRLNGSNVTIVSDLARRAARARWRRCR
jgi:hypothetical protein